MCYNRLSVFSTLAAVVLAAGLATPVVLPWDDVRVKHAWNSVPDDWENLGPPPANTTIDLHVALKPRNENALINALYEVSSPGHPKYGAFLSKEEAAKLVAPDPDTLELVHSWLSHHGLPSSSISMMRGGNWLKLTGVPVSQANQLLSASYQLYRDAGTNDSTILRTVGYGLPAVLHPHVKTVVPTTFFASIHTPSVGAAETAPNLKVGPRQPTPVQSGSSDVKDEITPTRLRWLYNTFAYVPKATDRNVLGIAGYMGQYPSPADLMKFMWIFRQTLDVDYDVERVNGGAYDPWHPGDEANLDMQYAQAIAYPTPVIYYSVGGQLQNDPITKKPIPSDAFFAWLTYLLDQTKIPQTICASYGAFEHNVPLEYATTMCDLFLELGTRGVSVLFASGDKGVGLGDCKAKDGSGKVQFSIMFPASCPWVTSVGGTTSINPEVAANLSTGGFSAHFPRPKYQEAAVPVFLQDLGSKYQGLYNATGRGVPDISAQALNYFMYNDTKSVRVNGTSASVPTVAATISLLNDYLIWNGKSPLGFLNPWLYGGGLEGLNDIISGFNPGCKTDGFSAVAGWDPVTGLGTPNFFKLQDLLYNNLIKTQNPLPTPQPSA